MYLGLFLVSYKIRAIYLFIYLPDSPYHHSFSLDNRISLHIHLSIETVTTDIFIYVFIHPFTNLIVIIAGNKIINIIKLSLPYGRE